MIKRQKIDMSEERKVLSQMIVSTPFLTQLKDIANPKLFKSLYSQTVAQWIWEYFEYTSEAPNRAIEDIYAKNKHTVYSEEENELIAEFLSNLSKDWERADINNVKYSVKNAIEFFKLRSLEMLRDDLSEIITSKTPSQGERIIADYKRVDKIKGHGVDIFRDAAKIRSAFQTDNEYLFSYPKLLGTVVGSFKRGDFFAIMGSIKKGKTWYLIYTAVRAALMGMKAVFISLEMVEDPVVRRFWKGIIGQPERKGAVLIPQFQEGGADNKLKIASKELHKEAINLEAVEEQQRKYELAARGGCIKLQTFPSYGASVRDIEDYLINLEYYEGFIPDVIVVDYADILLPENGRLDYRHQLDNIWKSLRGMAQKRECLVVTGTQTNKSALEKDASVSSIAEDMRKLAHVTGMMILNQNPLEKDAGVMRMSITAQREEKSFSKEIVLLQGLEIARPYLDCRLIDDVDMAPFEIKEKKKKK